MISTDGKPVSNAVEFIMILKSSLALLKKLKVYLDCQFLVGRILYSHAKFIGGYSCCGSPQISFHVCASHQFVTGSPNGHDKRNQLNFC